MLLSKKKKKGVLDFGTPSIWIFFSEKLKIIWLIKDFQSIIFSPYFDLLSVKEKIEEIKDFFSPTEIDHQLILSFSLDYAKIPIFKSFLSKLNLEEKDFIHFDQELLFHLLQSNISFPLSIIENNNVNISQLYGINIYQEKEKKLIIEKYLYEELQKQNQLEEFKTKIK